MSDEAFHQLRNIGLRSNNIEMTKMIGHLEREISSLQSKVSIAESELQAEKDRNKQLQAEIENLRRQVREYNLLLSKPMLEIAKKNGNFAATYNAQQEILADWMVSQKAFKELAIEFGGELGFSADQVIATGTTKKADVLDCKNNPDHNTNADHEFFKQHIPALKQKIQKGG